MIDACGYIEIGDFNMFGPDIYITDSNHNFGIGISPSAAPMQKGKVKIDKNKCVRIKKKNEIKKKSKQHHLKIKFN